MKVMCRYSGVVFAVPGFGTTRIWGEHPITTLPYRDLLPFYSDYLTGKLTEAEARVLFVSCLKQTDLLEFSVPAIPSRATIAKNFEFLLKTLDWKERISYSFPIPRYSVNESTRELKNIHQWIGSFDDARQDWLQRNKFAEERTNFLLLEDRINKLIHSAYRKTDSYINTLAKWAFIASDTPEDIKDYWLFLLRLKEPEIYDEKFRNDLDELLDHMTTAFTEGSRPLISHSLPAMVLLKHLRKQVFLNEKGYKFGLGEMTNEEQEEFATYSEFPFRIIPNIAERQKTVFQHNMDRAAALSTSEKPQANQFPTKATYLQALARWLMKQHKEKLEMEAEAATDQLNQSITERDI